LQTMGWGDSAVGFSGFDGNSAEVHLEIVSVRDVTRGRIATALTYAFVQLGCNRIWSRIATSNERCWRFVERLGFVREGVLRTGLYEGDAYMYSMLVSEYAVLMRRLLRIKDDRKRPETTGTHQSSDPDCARLDSATTGDRELVVAAGVGSDG
jgi:hypothetical protein